MTAEQTRNEAAPRVPIDRQHPQVYRAQIEVARAVRKAVEDVGLDRTLVELVNTRVSQLNGRAYCLHVHVRDARTQEQDYAEAARHLNDEQLSAVSWVTIAMNAVNRLSIVSRHRVGPQPSAEPSRNDELEGKAAA